MYKDALSEDRDTRRLWKGFGAWIGSQAALEGAQSGTFTLDSSARNFLGK